MPYFARFCLIVELALEKASRMDLDELHFAFGLVVAGVLVV
jgi:hypothetical protein